MHRDTRLDFLCDESRQSLGVRSLLTVLMMLGGLMFTPAVLGFRWISTCAERTNDSHTTPHGKTRSTIRSTTLIFDSRAGGVYIV